MTRFERWSVWGTSLLTFVSGLGFLWTKYFVETQDPWAAVNHPLEPWFLKVHVLAAPALIFAVGLIALRHIWRHLRTRTPRGWKSGVVLLGVLAPMVLTGYLIQVVTHAGALQALALAHIVAGIVYASVLGAHQWAVGRRRRDSDGYAASAAEHGSAERGDEGEPAVRLSREPFTAGR